MSYWVEFTDGTAGCVADAHGIEEVEKVVALVKPGKEVLAIHTLPYAASPLLQPSKEWTLCYSPRECKGRGSCPKSRACND